MKYRLLVCFSCFFFCLHASFAQTDEASIRDHVLNDIAQESEERTKELEEKITILDSRIKIIDSTLVKSNSAQLTIDKLRERVKILEEKQVAERNKELSVYKANFQTAVINLVSMEREIRPLELFEASKDFYSQVTVAANPTQYEGFDQWYATFKNYLDENKDKDASLNVTSQILRIAGDLSSEIGIAGALSNCLFSSIGKFIESLSSKRDTELRQQSEQMFKLVMILTQYTTDKNIIENDWGDIEKELEEIKRLQDTTLYRILAHLGIDRADFQRSFLEETNAIKTLNYLNKIKNLAGEKVIKERETNNESWKDKIYLEMQTVRSLKIRFGQTTTHIHGNIERYSGLFEKYEKVDFIGEKVSILKAKLDRLSKAFDSTFRPQKYISDAVKMYSVY